ncbi:MAG TPA: hypothetical protein PLF41_14310, partial [Anaerolineales bacterium]|nr:hypothetical protein [Anaerolineales bacterium]
AVNSTMNQKRTREFPRVLFDSHELLRITDSLQNSLWMLNNADSKEKIRVISVNQRPDFDSVR